MDQEPLVSVVVPVYNGMPYIEKAVQSALAALSADAEIVIRDNASDDGTTEWLKDVTDPRVRVLRCETLVSASDNWTLVSREAKGKWVKLLCADDYVTAGGLARQLEAGEKSGAVMVASRREVVDHDGQVVMKQHGLYRLVGEFDAADALTRSIASGINLFGEPSAVIIRRDALTEALPFTKDFPYLTDLDLYARVLHRGRRFVGLPSVDSGFRLSANQWTSKIGNEQLTTFRAWVRARLADGTWKPTILQRLSADVMIPAVFLARRLVHSRTVRKHKKRQP